MASLVENQQIIFLIKTLTKLLCSKQKFAYHPKTTKYTENKPGIWKVFKIDHE